MNKAVKKVGGGVHKAVTAPMKGKKGGIGPSEDVVSKLSAKGVASKGMAAARKGAMNRMAR